jgi:membrane fusion protein, copper/silver efflux system
MSSGTKRNVAIAIAAAALGAAAGIGGAAIVLRQRSAAHEEAAEQRYHCPMHPTYVSDKPGDCPICGMKLVPLEAADAGARPDIAEVPGFAGVQIDAQRQQVIGLRTTEATVGPVAGDWRTVGRVAVDETRVRKVNVKVDGFVEKLFVDYTGKVVRRGEPLFALYSPELLSAQQEYLLAVGARGQLGSSSAGDDLVSASRRRLELWDVPEAEIAALEKTRKPKRAVTMTSPISGVVTAKTVVQGARISAGDTPFEITDLSQVWVLADAHEHDLQRVRIGTPVSLTMEAIPNHVFEGRVSFIEPVLDARTRTAKVRLAFANPRGELRPEMFGEVVFHARPREAVRVPFDTIIDSGDRKIVFIALGNGSFVPREIVAGDSSGDDVEVIAGLHPGERVVSRANFLVDSESRLQAAVAALTSQPRKKDAAPHGTAHEAKR